MPARDYDGYLWLGLGVFIFAAVKGISWQLHEVVRLNEKKPESSKSDEQKQPTEDAIPLSVLETLAFCPNYDIREATNKIICARYIQQQFANHGERKLVFDGSDTEGVEALLDTLIRYGSNLSVELENEGEDDDSDTNEDFRRWRERRELQRSRRDIGDMSAEEQRLQEQVLRRRRREAVVVGNMEDGYEEVIVHEPVVLSGEVDAGGIAAILDNALDTADLGNAGAGGVVIEEIEEILEGQPADDGGLAMRHELRITRYGEEDADEEEHDRNSHQEEEGEDDDDYEEESEHEQQSDGELENESPIVMDPLLRTVEDDEHISHMDPEELYRRHPQWRDLLPSPPMEDVAGDENEDERP